MEMEGGSRAGRSGGGDGSAPAQLDNHLLAVGVGASVAHFFQGAGSLSQ